MLRDSRGLVVEETLHGPDGSLRADASSLARKKHRYDERGLLLETTFWTVDGKPAKDERGAVAIRRRYDEAGKSIEETAVGEKGAIVKKAAAGAKE